MIVKNGTIGSTPKFLTTINLPVYQLIAVMHTDATVIEI